MMFFGTLEIPASFALWAPPLLDILYGFSVFSHDNGVLFFGWNPFPIERFAMEVVGIVFVVFGSLVAMVLIIALTLLALVWGRKGAKSNQAEESKLIQEIYHGLAKMEERVESLETLLLERERQQR